MSVTCALVRCYFYKKGEVIELELDTTNRDRNYLFGRLLAIADRIESYARYDKVKKDETEKRPTNAVRYFSAYSVKPMRTWSLLFRQLNPYIQHLNGAEWFQMEIDEVMSLFDENEYNDKPLNGKYLLGYSLQRKILRQKNKITEEDVNELK
jgi:CRISPR-associated protein Csd1